MDWRVIEKLVLAAVEGLYIMVCKRMGNTETQIARFDLTAAHARSCVALLNADKRMDADLALTGSEGGVGDLDEPALRAVLQVAEEWTSQQCQQLADHTLRVKLRAISGSVLKTFTVAPVVVEDSEPANGAAGKADMVPVQQFAMVGQKYARDLIYLEERRHALDRERRTENRAETMELLNYDRTRDKERTDTLVNFLQDQLSRLRQDRQDDGVKWDTERARLNARITDLETQLNNVYRLAVEKSAEVRVADANAGTNEITIREIGRSVRELGGLSLKAAALYTMREKLTPELLNSLDKALSLDEDVLAILSDPAVQTALEDEQFLATLQDKEKREFFLNWLKTSQEEARKSA